MGELISALQILGARFTFEGQEQYPPFTLDTRATRTLETGARTRYEELPLVDLGSDESSQYLSGLLLSAPLYPQGLIIRLSGRKAVSWPYIGLTLDTMERFGLDFSVQETAADDGQIILAADWRSIKEAVPGRLRFLVRPGIYQAGVHTVEGDWSGASYFLAAGAIGPVPVRVNGLNPASLQGDAAILPILEGMGARIERGENCITVFPGPLRGIRVSMAHCPDLAPTVAAVAAHALGETRIEDAAHLKIKESDRLAAPARELAKAGCSVQVTADGLIIEPPQEGLKPPVDGTIFQTHGDHRIAMALSLLGLPGVRHNPGFAVRLDNPGCVAKSFPNFWELWEKVHSHSRGKADIVAGE
jgi:3-phosphoshikimate 1-carboxyvinyltransferase